MKFKTKQIRVDKLKKDYPLLSKIKFKKILEELKEKGLVEIENDKIFLTKVGMEIMTYVKRAVDERDKDVI